MLDTVINSLCDYILTQHVLQLYESGIINYSDISNEEIKTQGRTCPGVT